MINIIKVIASSLVIVIITGCVNTQTKVTTKEEKMSTIKHTSSFTINQPIEVMFPLFSAEGEKLWIPIWDYENIMGSTELREDYVFLTQIAGHGEEKTIWLVKQYKPKSYFVQFYRVEPNDKVAIITVECFKLAQTTTDVKVTYDYIGLSQKGNDFIDNYSENDHHKFIGEWETMLLEYFNPKDTDTRMKNMDLDY